MPQVLATLCWLLLLAILAVEDARALRLPLGANLAFVATGLAAGELAFGTLLADRLIGAGSGYGALQAIAYGYRAIRGRTGIGGGDPIMLAGLGAWLGWQPLATIVLTAALIGLGLAIAARLVCGAEERPFRLYRLPLGTLFAVGAVITVAGGH